MSFFDIIKLKSKSSDIALILEMYKRALGNGSNYELWTEQTEIHNEDTTKQQEKEQKERQKSLKKAIDRISERLKFFLMSGVWKVRTETKISDEDSKLQNLIINLNRQWISTKSLAESLYRQKETKNNEELNTLKVLIDEAINKIQTELKFRETRRDKRKFTFLIDT